MNAHAAARMALIAHIAGRPQPDWDAAVKAVLAAFREPTEEMVRAACAVECRDCYLDCERGPYRELWRAMIDEAGNSPGSAGA